MQSLGVCMGTAGKTRARHATAHANGAACGLCVADQGSCMPGREGPQDRTGRQRRGSSYSSRIFSAISCGDASLMSTEVEQMAMVAGRDGSLH